MVRGHGAEAASPGLLLASVISDLGPLGVGVGWAWGPAWPIVPAFWGRGMAVNWGASGAIVIDGGGYSRIAYGNAAWGGGTAANILAEASVMAASGAVW